MEGFVPMTIVLALGAGSLGAPDALRVLLDHAGHNPVVDITTCVLFIGTVTAQILGVVLLVRFIRNAPAQAGAGGVAARAPPTDCFAKMTLTVSVGVGIFVSACLVVVVPGGGLVSSTALVFDVAWKSPVTAVLVICPAGSLLCVIVPLLRVSHDAGNADGAGAAPATRATERFVGMTRTAYLAGLSLVGVSLVGIGLLLFNSFVEPDSLDALRLRHGFTDTFVGVGAAAALGALLLARFSPRRARNAAGTVVPAPATGAERFGKLRRNAFLMAVLCLALAAGVLSVLQDAYASPAHKPGSGKHACSA